MSFHFSADLLLRMAIFVGFVGVLLVFGIFLVLGVDEGVVVLGFLDGGWMRGELVEVESLEEHV